MLFHNLILAFRNYRRFRNTFLINLIGLSTGMVCSLLIYLWVDDELKMNQFHAKSDRMFQIMENQEYAEGLMTTYSTPGILAENIVNDFPEIEYAAVTTWIEEFTLSIEDHNINAEGYYVGSDYFNIFSYNLLEGDPSQVLKDKNSIVISKALAERLFNTADNVIGKMVEFQHKDHFQVTGLFEGTPKHSSVQFDFVLPFEKFKDDNEWTTYWGNNGPRSFCLLDKHANSDEVSTKIADYVKGKEDDSNVTLFLKPFSEVYLYGSYENGIQSGGRIEYVRLFSIIAVFILIIACINFMNLSTARASRRAKEIGIKKAIGASKFSLVIQYLLESLFMSFLSLMVAFLLLIIVLPQFNEITDKNIVLDFNLSMLFSFLGIALFTGLIAGSYPALYLSTRKTVNILKGQMKTSAGELIARKGLVIFQFFISVLLIVCVLVVYKQIDFVQSKNLGYNKDNVIIYEIEGKLEKSLETFLSEIKNIQGVIGASSVGHSLMGQNNNTSGLVWKDKNPSDRILFENVSSNYDMIDLLNIEVIEGRDFDRKFSQDSSKIIFNEAAIKIMNLDNPIGEKIKLWDDHNLEIIGVVKDFHFQSLHTEVKPLFIWLRPDNSWNVLTKIKAGEEKETLARIKDFYEDFNPGFNFEYKFMDDHYQKLYSSEQRVSTLSKYFGGIAIIISCLGLFGLASFTAERRTKEIGIRKALGSSSFNIIFLLTSDFTKMVFISIILAIPFGYYLMDAWLEDFAYRIELEWWFFLMAGLGALIIAWLTVGSQAIKAAHINPANCLRDE
ncbi:MAG: ABC transporter permease [Reichenbachiella sp.]